MLKIFTPAKVGVLAFNSFYLELILTEIFPSFLSRKIFFQAGVWWYHHVLGSSPDCTWLLPFPYSLLSTILLMPSIISTIDILSTIGCYLENNLLSFIDHHHITFILILPQQLSLPDIIAEYWLYSLRELTLIITTIPHFLTELDKVKEIYF